MLSVLRSLFQSNSAKDRAPAVAEINAEVQTHIQSDGAQPFPFENSLQFVHGLPTPDWVGIGEWVETLESNEARVAAWAESEIAWLQHLRTSLGPAYRLAKQADVLILSTLDERALEATFDFVSRSGKRILRVLDGVAEVSEWGHDILLVFDDQDTYYRYVSRYYQDDGEFSLSSGMYINQGCGHFAAVKSDLRSLEPIIVHEMTHAYLGHLPIPAWLNEGIAVNTEHRLTRPGTPLYTPQEMHEKHLMFWGDSEMQEFWSGQSFLRSDDGNMLSYDLARILVAHFSEDWSRFQPFVNSAEISDSGADAAKMHLGIQLGAAARSIFGQDNDGTWEPNPDLWQAPPERGAFALGAADPSVKRNGGIGLFPQRHVSNSIGQ